VRLASIYAQAFANYAGTFFPEHQGPVFHHILISAGILFPMFLNLTSPAIVVIKIASLLVVVAFGVGSVDPSRLAPSEWEAPLSIVGGGMLIFVAYEGFELIANMAPNVENADKVLPRAYYGSVGFVIEALYLGFRPDAAA
jgi:amino acid transporter